MNQLDKQYQELLFDIIENGVDKDTRNGKTRSVFGKQIRHKMKDGFPLLTTKKMYWKGIVTELLWFLRGDTNIKYLIDNNCNIWTGDAYKKYSEHFIGYEDVPNQDWFIHEIKTNPEFAKKWGELGPVYGKQWRKWGKKTVIAFGVEHWIKGIDQITNLINDLKNTEKVETPDGNYVVAEGLILRKASRFAVGTAQDALIPIPVFYDEFPTEEAAYKKAKGDPYEAQQLMEEWAKAGTTSTNMGSRVHFELETETLSMFNVKKEVRQPVYECDMEMTMKGDRMINAGKKFVVRACQNGQSKVVRFGDANMTIKKSNPERKKSYCARSGGIKGKANKLSANYWSRRAWEC